MGVLRSLVEGLTGPVATYLTRRAEIALAKHQATLAIEQAQGERAAKLISEGLAADASWEMEQIRNSGWKDEVGFLAFLAAVFSCFIPAAAPHTLRGFEILGQTPIWFQVAAVAVLLAPFGIRTWRRQQYDSDGKTQV